MITVASTDIVSLDYDAARETLTVVFRKGNRTYVYCAVPQAVYEVVRDAPSVGKAFAAAIKGKYEYEEIKA